MHVAIETHSLWGVNPDRITGYMHVAFEAQFVGFSRVFMFLPRLCTVSVFSALPVVA